MTKLLAAGFLRLLGWRAEGQRPTAPKFVLIAAPHTSNWDLLFMLAFGAYFDVKPSFMAKHTVFVGPAGWLLRWLGGIPIERHHSQGVVKEMAEAFAAADRLVLAVPAEGTRSRVDVWKSGFYQIARQADVPIVMSYLDYARKVAGFGPAFVPTGNVREDMDLVRDFYADKVGLHPELFGEIRLREEGPAART